MSKILQADQICYAVLCVFSYFAAGQEQKKAILEQAARVPSVPATTPTRLVSPKKSPSGPSGDAKPIGPEASDRRVTRELPPVTEPSPRPAGVAPAAGASGAGTAAATAATAPSGAGAAGVAGAAGAAGGLQRAASTPPRRPPPPATPPATPPASAHPRVTRAHSTAAPSRPPDPPMIPPRSGTAGQRPIGPPPALPPRQLSAGADFNSTSRASGSSARRQTSSGAPFSANPFTSPRHAEFVIPQRNNIRRSSTTDRN